MAVHGSVRLISLRTLPTHTAIIALPTHTAAIALPPTHQIHTHPNIYYYNSSAGGGVTCVDCQAKARGGGGESATSRHQYPACMLPWCTEHSAAAYHRVCHYMRAAKAARLALPEVGSEQSGEEQLTGKKSEHGCVARSHSSQSRSPTQLQLIKLCDVKKAVLMGHFCTYGGGPGSITVLAPCGPMLHPLLE